MHHFGAQRRGCVILGPAVVRVTGPWGLGWRQTTIDSASKVRVDPNLAAIDVYEALSALSSGGVSKLDGLTALLADFGMVGRVKPAARKPPAVTPLGSWVASRLAEVFPVPLDARLATAFFFATGLR